MRYGVLIKIEGKFPVGTVFSFDRMDEDNWFRVVCFKGENFKHSFEPEFGVEIVEQEYKRLSGNGEDYIHPIIKETFDKGDFGCQQDDVRELLVAITKAIKEEK